MTVATFYPDYHPETSSVDGEAGRATYDLTWAQLHDGAGDAGLDANSDFRVRLYSDQTTDLWYQLWRCIMTFDTSSIPVGSVINSVKLGVYGSSKNKTASWALAPAVYGSTPLSDTGVVAADYGRLGTIPLSNVITYDDIDPDGWNEFILNAAGRAAIVLGGITRLALRDSIYDVPDSEPTWESNKHCTIIFHSADFGTPPSASRPYLEVTYGTGEPTVSTQECTNVTAEKATGHGTLIAFGGAAVTQHGHCWSTSPYPTTANSKTLNGAAPNLGQFQSLITGLDPATTYYVRAYATNSYGTNYGDNVSIRGGSTIGRRYWWVEKDEFHFWSEWGDEMFITGTKVGGFE